MKPDFWQVVLADGSIVNANAKERSDLFWGLKGGGPNFGQYKYPRVGYHC